MSYRSKVLQTIHESPLEYHVHLPCLSPRKPNIPKLRLSSPTNPSPKINASNFKISPENTQQNFHSPSKSTIFQARPPSNDVQKRVQSKNRVLITQEESPCSSKREAESPKSLLKSYKNQSCDLNANTLPSINRFSKVSLPSLEKTCSSNYDDDEDLNTIPYERKYDIKNQFDIFLKLRKNIIRSNPVSSDSYPFLATIKANNPPYFKKSPVDVVCVIDKSGSMNGEKLDYVKQALGSIIDLLDENDRLSIVSFNEYAQKETNLRCMTPENKAQTLSIIKNIEADGLTNIGDGMEQAIKILENRRSVNHISGIFLLSDGLDKHALNLVTETLANNEIKGSFAVHTFGFGNDHDPELMTQIADLKLGNFYFVEDLKIVDQAFLNCLGSLAYSFASEGEITFTPQHNSVLDEQIEICRPMGDLAIWTKNGDSYTAKIGHLIANKTYNFVLKIKVPKNERELKTDRDKVIDVIQARFTFKDLKGNSFEIVKMLSVHLLNDYEPLPTFKDDRDVVAQYFRVKTYEVLVQARKLAEKYHNKQALDLLMKFRLELEVCIVRRNPLIQALIHDIVNAQSDVAPKNFAFSGKHNLIAVSRAQGQEKYSFQSSVSYSTPGQDKYQGQAKSIPSMFKLF